MFEPLLQLCNVDYTFRTFSVQLKILSAVKAAPTADDSDADDQIISATQSLGKSMADALRSIEITKKSGLLR